MRGRRRGTPRGSPRAFRVRYGIAAAEDLAQLRPYDSRRIEREIESILTAEPLRLVPGSREPVQEPIPDSLAERVAEAFPGGTPWSLHVGEHRVIYAVEGATVWVVAVVLKGRKTFSEAFS